MQPLCVRITNHEKLSKSESGVYVGFEKARQLQLGPVMDFAMKIFCCLLVNFQFNIFDTSEVTSDDNTILAEAVDLYPEYFKLDDDNNKYVGRIRRDIGKEEETTLINNTKFEMEGSRNLSIIVGWSEGNVSTAMLLLFRAPKKSFTNESRSNFVVTRNDNQSFDDLSEKLSIHENETNAIISDFFTNPLNSSFYILTARDHSMLFITNDEGRNFTKVHTDFYPGQIKFHPIESSYMLAYEQRYGHKRVYASTNSGRNWTLQASRVKEYSWGATLYDGNDIFYYMHKDSKSLFRKNIVTNQSTVLMENIVDFKLLNQILFVIKKNDDGTQALFVSAERSSSTTNITFVLAQFGVDRNIIQRTHWSYVIVSESVFDQVLIGVRHDNMTRSADLYIAVNEQATMYSLVLRNVIYNNRDDEDADNYTRHDYVDMHKVLGVTGVYIANTLPNNHKEGDPVRPVTRITFNNGALWSYVNPPANDIVTCTLEKNCSLHFSEEAGYHDPTMLHTQIFTRESAPGLILASGNIGQTISKSSSFVYISTDAGLNWRNVLEGRYYYGFVDHGGVIVAVERMKNVTSLQYSWDEGRTWGLYNFTSEPVQVMRLYPEPKATSTVFVLFAYRTSKWIVFKIDVKLLLGEPCTKDNYTHWQLEGKANSTCVLGVKRWYEKRKADAKCLNTKSYMRHNTSAPCTCARHDFACDFGFTRVEMDSFTEECHPIGNITHSKISKCIPGKRDERSKGYRKLPTDKCEGGEENRYAPKHQICPLPNATNFIFYANTSALIRYDIIATSFDSVDLMDEKELIVSLDFNYASKVLYYVDFLDRAVVTLNMKTGIYEKLIQVDQRFFIRDVACDWMNDNVYFTVADSRYGRPDTLNSSIHVVSHDSDSVPMMPMFKKVLFSTDAFLQCLVVHPAKGIMFVAAFDQSYGQRNASILRLNMDGSNVTKIGTSISQLTLLDIDYEGNGSLYLMDSFGMLRRMDLNGENEKVILKRSSDSSWMFSVGQSNLIVHNGSAGLNSLVDKDSGNITGTVYVMQGNVLALNVFWKGKQQPVDSKCVGEECKFGCLSISNESQCLCPEFMIKTGRRCSCPNTEISHAGKSCRAAENGTCAADRFQCTATRDCIPSYLKCNGQFDCADRTDENNCSKSVNTTMLCESDNFWCEDNECLPKMLHCDGRRDCVDGTDEQHCNKPTTPTPTTKPTTTTTTTTTATTTTPPRHLPAIDCDIPIPFKFQCGEKCYNVSIVCDGNNDCNKTDEDTLVCENSNRVSGVEVENVTSTQINLKWKRFDEKMAYIVAYSRFGDEKSKSFPVVLDSDKLKLNSDVTATIKPVRPCSKYRIAVAIKITDLSRQLYVETVAETQPADFPVTKERNSVIWDEENITCVKGILKSRKLICTLPTTSEHSDQSQIKREFQSNNISNISKLLNVALDENEEVSCYISIAYKGVNLQSQRFTYAPGKKTETTKVPKQKPAKTKPVKTKPKKSTKWVTPVVVVIVLVFLVLLGVLWWKRESLQQRWMDHKRRSNYTRYEDEMNPL